MTYAVSADAYLARAVAELSSGETSRLFYAAFELRAGIEARLQEYLEHALHVPARQKRDWAIAKLGLSVDRAFSIQKVARVEVRDNSSGALLLRVFYTPVSKELQGLGKRLGGYLHATEFRKPDDPWWADFRTKLEVGCQLLDEAVQGELLGPPILNRKTGQVWMPMIVPDGVDVKAVFQKGSEFAVEYRYFGSLADARGDAA